jgi:hypothetical protein
MQQATQEKTNLVGPLTHHHSPITVVLVVGTGKWVMTERVTQSSRSFFFVFSNSENNKRKKKRKKKKS